MSPEYDCLVHRRDRVRIGTEFVILDAVRPLSLPFRPYRNAVLMFADPNPDNRPGALEIVEVGLITWEVPRKRFKLDVIDEGLVYGEEPLSFDRIDDMTEAYPRYGWKIIFAAHEARGEIPGTIDRSRVLIDERSKGY